VKSFLAALVLACVLPTGARAQQKMEDMKGMEMPGKPGATKPTAHNAVGVVKKVDPKAGTVTFAHEPVKSMNWPAMTMTFKVKDKALFDKLTSDKRVEFEFTQEGKDYVVTAIK
jgi:Cu(I)/Ag(I) efflux system protein CusF